MKNKKKCFVITPIGQDDSEIRRHIDGVIKVSIIPALENKYSIRVAHQINDTGSITTEIIKDIFESDLCVVNLTYKNPNVMYELAVRYCTGKPVILIAERQTQLPFDISPERTIMYINDGLGLSELKTSIERFEKDIDFSNNEQGPIYNSLKALNIYKDAIFENNKGFNAINDLLNKIDDLSTKIMDQSIIIEKLRKKRIRIFFNKKIDEENLIKLRELISKGNLEDYVYFISPSFTSLCVELKDEYDIEIYRHELINRLEEILLKIDRKIRLIEIN